MNVKENVGKATATIQFLKDYVEMQKIYPKMTTSEAKYQLETAFTVCLKEAKATIGEIND